jgi:hypothetical protein
MADQNPNLSLGALADAHNAINAYRPEQKDD